MRRSIEDSEQRRRAGDAAPRVSIVIPVFNAGRDLERALASIAAQTFADHETIVVDDGSTDPQTRTLLETAAARGAIVLHRTPNGGPARARNLAIEHARGAYILPLDADDRLAPTFLARTVAVLEAEPPVGIVYTWARLTGAHHGIWRTGGFTVPELLSRCTIHVSALYRRQVWEQVGGYDPRFVESCEDWDFWLGAAARGWQGRGIPEPLVEYQRRTTGREARSRAPGVSTRLMATLVAKHRALYEQHLEAALGGMYERLQAAGVALERVYDHPAIRFAVKLRGLVRRRSAA